MPWSNSIAWAPTSGMIAAANMGRDLEGRRRDAENQFELQKQYMEWMTGWLKNNGLMPSYQSKTTSSANPPVITFDKAMQDAWGGQGVQGYTNFINNTSETIGNALYAPIQKVIDESNAKYGTNRAVDPRKAAARGFSANSPALNIASRLDLAEKQSGLYGQASQYAQQAAQSHHDANWKSRHLQYEYDRRSEENNRNLGFSLLSNILGGFKYSPLTGSGDWSEKGSSQGGSQGFSAHDWDPNSHKRDNPTMYLPK